MKTESQVQAELLLHASRQGIMLLRNNSGVAREPDGNGGTRYVRYGLGNTSKKINEKYKSCDLIGITPVVITPDMVGKTLGVFTGIEVKKEGWSYTGKGRETAQNNFIKLVESYYGFAGFISDPDAFKLL